MKNYISAFLLATTAFSAAANTFYITTSLHAADVPKSATISLSNIEIPPVFKGIPYSLNLDTALIKSPGFDKPVHWSVTSQNPRITINPNTGLLSAIIDEPGPIQITVKAHSGNASAVKTYTIPHHHHVSLVDGIRAWSNGSLASNCAGYINPEEGFSYAGDTGDGMYRIMTPNGPTNVYCDMTHDGGGWMLVYNIQGPTYLAFAAQNTQTVTPAASGSLASMGSVFQTATEFRWTDTAVNRFLQGRTHMPTWYQKFTTQACNAAGNTIQVQFEGGWLNTATQPRAVESCTTYPFGMRNSMNYSKITDIPGFINGATHMCWFDNDPYINDRPFANSLDTASPYRSHCTQFNYDFPASAARGGTMDYMVWVR